MGCHKSLSEPHWQPYAKVHYQPDKAIYRIYEDSKKNNANRLVQGSYIQISGSKRADASLARLATYTPLPDYINLIK